MFGMRNYDGRLNIGERSRLLSEIYSRAATRMLNRGESMPKGGHVKFMDQVIRS